MKGGDDEVRSEIDGVSSPYKPSAQCPGPAVPCVALLASREGKQRHRERKGKQIKYYECAFEMVVEDSLQQAAVGPAGWSGDSSNFPVFIMAGAVAADERGYFPRGS